MTDTDPKFFISAPKYLCPKHGTVENVITSWINGHEGAWCQICFLESLDRAGVMRCEKEKTEQT